MNAITASSLAKSFGRKQALDGVSLEVPQGVIFGFLGPNGAGKTTTIRCLMDYIRPDAGSTKLLGKDARHDSVTLKRQVGYLSSDMQLNGTWSGHDHLELFERVKGRGKMAAELVKRLDVDMHAQVRHLSSGNQQKLAIVLAFAGQPRLLIMDEPTRGLDPLLQNELYRILREFRAAGNTVFLSSHNLSEVQRLCDEVALIKNGRIMERASMAAIRDLGMHVVTAVTTLPVDRNRFEALEGVEIVSANTHEVTLKLRGELNPAMKQLTMLGLRDLSVAHASLEDIFLEEYEEARNV